MEIDGTRIYHVSDTDLIDEMRDFIVNIALLPVSGTYVMTAEEAVEAVERLKPKRVIPMHNGTVVGSNKDAKKLAQALKGKTEVLILQPQKPASARKKRKMGGQRRFPYKVKAPPDRLLAAGRMILQIPPQGCVLQPVPVVILLRFVAEGITAAFFPSRPLFGSVSRRHR